MKSRFFNPRSTSLLRGSALVVFSLGIAFRLSNFPYNHPTLLLVFPALVATIGTADTIRCIKPQWNLYYGGVLLLIYMDLMAVCIILFFLFYPYASWITSQ